MLRCGLFSAGALASVFGLALLVPAAPVVAQGVDIGAIFNCDAGGPLGEQTPEQCSVSRDTLLGTCTTCHTFVPIVKAHKSPELWDTTLQAHRVRTPNLTDEQFAELTLFLKAHFNDQLDPPTLPPELEALGTGLPF
jgi:hypothetical protein